MRFAAALALTACLAFPARAVIIDSGDGTGNTSAPSDDPGWAYVGTRTQGGMTVIYLGNRWVLTANHVSDGDVIFGGVTYPAVSGSRVQLQNTSGNPPDLAVFQLAAGPDLPILPIRATSPSVNDDVILIGKGRNRGDPTSWQPNPPFPPTYDGYQWGPGTAMRWGTNRVDGFATVPVSLTNTESFYTDFTEHGGTQHESQAATGDSGGAAFLQNGATWELAGVLFAIGTYSGQPSMTALYGNLSYAADLSVYRDQIIALTRPECSDEVDNDGDAKIDYPDDPQCSSPEDPSERLLPTRVPGLTAAGAVLLAALLIAAAVLTPGRRLAAGL